jgi:hypothetical protein
MKKITLLTAVLCIILLPDLAQAQVGLVPTDLCDGPTCSACHIVELINRLIKWLIGIVILLFAVLAVWAGFGLVTSGGNPSALSDAKSRFTNAFIGFLIVLAAWLLVDTLMRGIVSGTDGNIKGYGPWSQVQCFSQSEVGIDPGKLDITINDAPESGTDVFIGPGLGGPGGPVTLSPSGTSCFPGGNGVIDGPPAFTPGSDDICLDTSSVSGSSYNLPDGSGLGYSAPSQYFGPGAIAANPRLTPNLRLCDVTNCGADRRTGDYVVIDPFMVAQLENVYGDLGGLQVNSGYRSPAYNRKVGGATHSRHQYGDAVDIRVTSSNTEAMIEASCRRRGATNIYTYDSGAHVHCDWRGAPRP